MAKIVVEIPMLGFVSALGRAGQEEAIFQAITAPSERLAFFSQASIMSDDPRIAAISDQTGLSVNDLIGPFGGNE